MQTPNSDKIINVVIVVALQKMFKKMKKMMMMTNKMCTGLPSRTCQASLSFASSLRHFPTETWVGVVRSWADWSGMCRRSAEGQSSRATAHGLHFGEPTAKPAHKRKANKNLHASVDIISLSSPFGSRYSHNDHLVIMQSEIISEEIDMYSTGLV